MRSRSASSRRSPACRARASRRWSTRSSTSRSPTGCTGRGCGRARTTRRGIDQLDKIIYVDQSPIGRTPRSNPATYIGLFDQIRDLFAKTQEAKVRGYKPGASRSTSRAGAARSAAATARSRSRCTSCPTSTCRASSATASATTARRSTSASRARRSPTSSTCRSRRRSSSSPTSRRSSAGCRTLHDVGLDYMRLGPARDDALRRRGAAGQAGPSWPQGRNGQDALHPRRADHRPALRGHPAAAGGPAAPGRPGQLGRGDRAQPRRDQDRRPHHRHGPRGRGRRRRVVVAAGTPEEVAAVEGSYTGRFLAGIVEPRLGPAGAAAPEGRGGGVRDPDATADCASAARVRRPGMERAAARHRGAPPGQEPRTRTSAPTATECRDAGAGPAARSPRRRPAAHPERERSAWTFAT